MIENLTVRKRAAWRDDTARETSPTINSRP